MKAWAKDLHMVEVEAAKADSLRDAEIQKLEKMNALTISEKLKAQFLSKARVEYETR